MYRGPQAAGGIGKTFRAELNVLFINEDAGYAFASRDEIPEII